MLTVLEVAKRLDRDPETTRRWIRCGRLPATKLGLRHRVAEDDLPCTDDDVPGPKFVATSAGKRIALRDMLQIIAESRAGR